MKIAKTVQKEVEILIDALCNKCGESCIPPKAREPWGTPVKWVPGVGLCEATREEVQYTHAPNLYGLIEQTVGGGFDSYALQDMESYTFSMCEGCLKELFDTFKIPVQTSEPNED